MTKPETALRAAKAGASVAADYYQSSLSVETKDSKTDYVTEADTNAQQRVIEEIRADYPDATIVGEEEDELKEIPTAGNAWVIDPIDGTTNFIHDIPLWTTSVAVVEGGETIAGISVAPALEHVFVADEKGGRRDDTVISVSETTDLDTVSVAPILKYGPERDAEFGDLLAALITDFGDLRRLGSAQLTLALVAAGSLDATVSTQPEPRAWDTVGGVHLVRQAGGTVTDVHGDAWEPGCEGIVATNGEIHEAVLETVQAVES